MRTRLMLFLVIVAIGLVVATHAQSGASESNIGTESNQSTIIWTSVIGFLSLLVTQFVSLWRDHQRRESEKQQREWDLADRAAARAEVLKQVKEQKLETIETAVQLARVVNAQKEEITQQIRHNTEITKQTGRDAMAAIEAGNNYAQRVAELRKELFGKKGQLDHIEEVAVDTQEKVTEIVEEVSAKDKEG